MKASSLDLPPTLQWACTLWASLGLDPTYIGCYFWSNNESRDSIDCFYGCLEGPSIFLESFIFLYVLICACGEGEIVAVMA